MQAALEDRDNQIATLRNELKELGEQVKEMVATANKRK